MSGREEAEQRDAPPASVERFDTAGTSAAAEVSHVRSSPRVPTATTPVTLQSLHNLLLEEMASRQRVEEMLAEDKAARLCMEVMLHEEAASRRRLIDGMMELAGYYSVMSREQIGRAHV